MIFEHFHSKPVVNTDSNHLGLNDKKLVHCIIFYKSKK